MPAFYKEIQTGSSAYAAAPNATCPFECHFEKFRVVAGGASGADMFISWDGLVDHARIPAPGATLYAAPIQFDVNYKALWVRSLGGVTATLGAGWYSR